MRTFQPPVPGPGLVVANPPYGKRVGEGGELPELYRALGATLRRAFQGWRAALIVPEEDGLIRDLGLRDTAQPARPERRPALPAPAVRASGSVSL